MKVVSYNLDSADVQHAFIKKKVQFQIFRCQYYDDQIIKKQ